MDNDKTMESLITSWGLPECLEHKKDHIVFRFSDEGLTGTREKGYHCKNGNVKFCLYDEKLNKVLFSMDFFKINSSLSQKSTPFIQLELLYVHDDSMRRKGVGSYYLARLREYAISEKVKGIYVRANGNAKNFKNDSKVNALSQERLVKYYENKNTPEMPVYVE